jgi:glucose-6-phosphate isomerase
MVNISKSGGTQETKGNMDTFNALLSKQNLSMGPHNIAVTTPSSNFDKFAQQNKFMKIFYMNNETGGRTSIVSAVGMVPSAFARLSFDDFLKGQSYMDELTRKENILENPALLVSIGIDILTKQRGRKNMIVLGYSDFLKEFSHYLQQLYMESLGKEYDENGVPNVSLPEKKLTNCSQKVKLYLVVLALVSNMHSCNKYKRVFQIVLFVSFTS